MVVMLNIEGTGASDLLYGTNGHDNIRGSFGNDTIFSSPLSDRVAGNAGNDVLVYTDLSHSQRDDSLDMPFDLIIFGSGPDTIDLSRVGVTSFSQLAITETVDQYGDYYSEVNLIGTNFWLGVWGKLDPEDFYFVGDPRANHTPNIKDPEPDINTPSGNDTLTPTITVPEGITPGTNGDDLLSIWLKVFSYNFSPIF